MDRWSTMQVAQRDLRRHPSSLEYLSAILEKAKSEIASDGYISEESRHKIFDAFFFWDCLLALYCQNSGPPKAETEDQSPEKGLDSQADKKRAGLVALIDNRLGRISAFKGLAKERENLALDAEGRSFSFATSGCYRQNSPL
jgi:CRISPR/Cas system-associated protein Cas10 (large subunit of type III CRISPR-Cas system)